jgi:hypothetical protein
VGTPPALPSSILWRSAPTSPLSWPAGLDPFRPQAWPAGSRSSQAATMAGGPASAWAVARDDGVKIRSGCSRSAEAGSTRLHGGPAASAADGPRRW